MKLPQRFSSERSEAGETLIEVLMSTALMGLVVVGMIGGLAATVLGSHIHREQSDAQAFLVRGMERIKSTDLDFSAVDCKNADGTTKSDTDRKTAYETAARAVKADEVPVPTGWTIAVSSVSFEDVALVAGTWNVSFTGTCVPGLRRQLVTLRLTSRDLRAAPALSFVKGDV
ncbi:MAG: hypothetical protein QOF53_891 [Nocardioidaceae bacterium]|jgi:Tfp pilus assembly protein PilV|nr:hypothetical protein [Nocardioidaceae bacterium]